MRPNPSPCRGRAFPGSRTWPSCAGWHRFLNRCERSEFEATSVIDSRQQELSRAVCDLANENSRCIDHTKLFEDAVASNSLRTHRFETLYHPAKHAGPPRGLIWRSMTQLLIQPCKCFVLHGDRPAVRFVVEAAEELLRAAGGLIEFGDALDGGPHSGQREESVL